MPTVTPLRNKNEFRWGITEDEEGLRGVQNFHVDTLDEYLALTAPGIPALGSVWSANYPNLKARTRLTYPLGGTDNGTLAGSTRVEIIYRDDRRGGVIEPPPGIGQDWTLLVPSVATEAIIEAVDAVAGDEPLANGQGTSRELFVEEAHIHHYRAVEDFNTAYVSKLLALSRSVNDNQISLPRVAGAVNNDFIVDPGKARYRMHQPPRLVGTNLVEVVHVVALTVDDFLFRWRVEQADGTLGDTLARPIYFEKPYSGLWVGA